MMRMKTFDSRNWGGAVGAESYEVSAKTSVAEPTNFIELIMIIRHGEF